MAFLAILGRVVRTKWWTSTEPIFLKIILSLFSCFGEIKVLVNSILLQ